MISLKEMTLYHNSIHQQLSIPSLFIPTAMDNEIKEYYILGYNAMQFIESQSIF
jgi:hypothetical protein